MNDLSIFPADIAEMSVSQLANLPAQQLVEVDTNLDQAIAWLKAARTKLDGALDQRFGAQGRESLNASGRDFGTAHVKADGLHVKFDLPKKVSWDQKKLKTIGADLGGAVRGFKNAMAEAEVEVKPEASPMPKVAPQVTQAEKSAHG